MNNNPIITEDINIPTISPDREKVPEIFTRHMDTWKGEYIKTDKHGHFSPSFVGTFTISIEGNQYRQVNNYEYSNGSRLQLNFEGYFEDKILKLFSSSYADFSAIAWDAGQDIICFRANKTQDDGLITFMETMTLLDENHRVRSTQVFKDGIFDGISFIEEIRC
ncbi:hypothetical protein [Calothrix sp. 336/3]|uniref:hypothetical protein n=1 Tax=Calothrix sp. 336/3 TaxID=1337936 RepID=UPI000624AD06|nr:hypothetical protein [Calothrix sp. 336/3]AKG23625.1 hypothetical protein IJ00_22135 [Calothrix sp. 336/3]